MIGVVAFRAPGMAVGRVDAVAVKVVEQDELPGQGMMVGRDKLRINAQTGIAVPLWEVSEHLIVGFVLLEDIEHIVRVRASKKFQIPNPKSQTKSKFQIPTERRNRQAVGAWSLRLVWDLGFGIRNFLILLQLSYPNASTQGWSISRQGSTYFL